MIVVRPDQTRTNVAYEPTNNNFSHTFYFSDAWQERGREIIYVIRGSLPQINRALMHQIMDTYLITMKKLELAIAGKS